MWVNRRPPQTPRLWVVSSWLGLLCHHHPLLGVQHVRLQLAWHPQCVRVAEAGPALSSLKAALPSRTPVPPCPLVCSVSGRGDPAVPCRVSSPQSVLSWKGVRLCCTPLWLLGEQVSWPLASASPPGKWDCATKGEVNPHTPSAWETNTAV